MTYNIYDADYVPTQIWLPRSYANATNKSFLKNERVKITRVIFSILLGTFYPYFKTILLYSAHIVFLGVFPPIILSYKYSL